MQGKVLSGGLDGGWVGRAAVEDSNYSDTEYWRETGTIVRQAARAKVQAQMYALERQQIRNHEDKQQPRLK